MQLSRRFFSAVLMSGFLLFSVRAQTDPYLTPPATQPSPSASAPGNSAPAASQDQVPPVQDNDFLLDGIPYAKALDMVGTVEIEPPGETSFRPLTLDEPIAVGSIIHTGLFSKVDLATGVGMAIRLTPRTVMVLKALPGGGTGLTPVPGAPAPAELDLKHGTIISALGREDAQAIDFQVTTPQGVAAARGTLFAVSSYSGGSEVNMLHGTVNFETPDHQKSQIEAGDSQEITGEGAGNKFILGQRQPFSVEKGERLFKPSSALLERANGYGIVRRGLGDDTVRALEKRGYHFSAEARQRFLNARNLHYQRRAFNEQYRPRTEQLTPRPANNPNREQDRTDRRPTPAPDPFPAERRGRKRDF